MARNRPMLPDLRGSSNGVAVTPGISVMPKPPTR
jgi:hypothetical protein